jgi:hypothetical protein
MSSVKFYDGQTLPTVIARRAFKNHNTHTNLVLLVNRILSLHSVVTSRVLQAKALVKTKIMKMDQGRRARCKFTLSNAWFPQVDLHSLHRIHFWTLRIRYNFITLHMQLRTISSVNFLHLTSFPSLTCCYCTHRNLSRGRKKVVCVLRIAQDAVQCFPFPPRNVPTATISSPRRACWFPSNLLWRSQTLSERSFPSSLRE